MFEYTKEVANNIIDQKYKQYDQEIEKKSNCLYDIGLLEEYKRLKRDKFSNGFACIVYNTVSIAILALTIPAGFPTLVVPTLIAGITLLLANERRREYFADRKQINNKYSEYKNYSKTQLDDLEAQYKKNLDDIEKGMYNFKVESAEYETIIHNLEIYENINSIVNSEMGVFTQAKTKEEYDKLKEEYDKYSNKLEEYLESSNDYSNIHFDNSLEIKKKYLVKKV